jgi:hypothetical protein
MYIRAVVRDMKEYIAQNIGRSIGVGYSAADVDTLLSSTWNYLNCELTNSTQSKVDFFGLNVYEWCGDSSFTESGYNKLVTLFGQDTSIPVFFSEYGCNNIEPRTFTNVPVLYGDEMSVLSGGLAFEYSQESNNFGLVSINSSTELTLSQDYNFLALQFANIDISSLETANTTAEKQTATSCAASVVTGANFTVDWDLPSAPSGAAAIITSGLKSGFLAGSIVAVSTTTMPATVLNYTGSTVTGLKLVELMCTDSNYPGLINDYSSSSVSCNYATATGGGSASATKKSAGNVEKETSIGGFVLGLLVASLVCL